MDTEFTDTAFEGSVVEPVPSRREMRRTFSRMALGLCLGLLVSQLVPTVLQSIIPDYDAQAHAFLVGGLCTGLFTLPVMLLLTRRRRKSLKRAGCPWAASSPWWPSATPA